MNLTFIACFAYRDILDDVLINKKTSFCCFKLKCQYLLNLYTDVDDCCNLGKKMQGLKVKLNYFCPYIKINLKNFIL